MEDTELYKKVVEIHKLLYKKDGWNKEKYKTKTGHMLRSLFKTFDIWMIKDLDEKQLNTLLDTMRGHVESHPVRFANLKATLKEKGLWQNN